MHDNPDSKQITHLFSYLMVLVFSPPLRDPAHRDQFGYSLSTVQQYNTGFSVTLHPKDTGENPVYSSTQL